MHASRICNSLASASCSLLLYRELEDYPYIQSRLPRVDRLERAYEVLSVRGRSPYSFRTLGLLNSWRRWLVVLAVLVPSNSVKSFVFHSALSIRLSQLHRLKSSCTNVKGFFWRATTLDLVPGSSPAARYRPISRTVPWPIASLVFPCPGLWERANVRSFECSAEDVVRSMIQRTAAVYMTGTIVVVSTDQPSVLSQEVCRPFDGR